MTQYPKGMTLKLWKPATLHSLEREEIVTVEKVINRKDGQRLLVNHGRYGSTIPVTRYLAAGATIEIVKE